MLLKDALKVSPLGYAKRSSERGDVYATNGGLFLELGGALRPITLPPDKIDTWEPVMPEVEQEAPTSAETLGPDRWADRTELDPERVVVHREKRRSATL